MITARRDVVYARPAGFRPLCLDLYVPEEALALCLYVHGGGWRLGSRREGPGVSKDWEPSFFHEVAELGMAVASLDYRLSGEAHYPAQQEDLLAAHHFLINNADTLGCPTTRTTVWGVSAGGQRAAVHALRPDPERTPVSAAVCWYTPTDLDGLSHDLEAADQKGDRSLGSREGQLVGAAIDEAPALVKAASAVHQVRAGAPPFLLLHGDADTSVPPVQSARLADALRDAGGQATFELVPGATHLFPEVGDEAMMRLLRHSVDFLLTA